MSAADFVDNTNFFMNNLLYPRKKNGPFFMEFWQYLNVCRSFDVFISIAFIQDTFTKTWDKTDWNRTVLGVPVGQKDPRFSSSP